MSERDTLLRGRSFGLETSESKPQSFYDFETQVLTGSPKELLLSRNEHSKHGQEEEFQLSLGNSPQCTNQTMAFDVDEFPSMVLTSTTTKFSPIQKGQMGTKARGMNSPPSFLPNEIGTFSQGIYDMPTQVLDETGIISPSKPAEVAANAGGSDRSQVQFEPSNGHRNAQEMLDRERAAVACSPALIDRTNRSRAPFIIDLTETQSTNIDSGSSHNSSQHKFLPFQQEFDSIITENSTFLIPGSTPAELLESRHRRGKKLSSSDHESSKSAISVQAPCDRYSLLGFQLFSHVSIPITNCLDRSLIFLIGAGLNHR
jgi:hypothetical protein